MIEKDKAVCIRATDYSETSQIVTFFTAGKGKVSADLGCDRLDVQIQTRADQRNLNASPTECLYYLLSARHPGDVGQQAGYIRGLLPGPQLSVELPPLIVIDLAALEHLEALQSLFLRPQLSVQIDIGITLNFEGAVYVKESKLDGHVTSP